MLRNGFDRKKAWETCRGSNTSLQAILALGKPAEPPRVRALLFRNLPLRARNVFAVKACARVYVNPERGVDKAPRRGKTKTEIRFVGKSREKRAGRLLSPSPVAQPRRACPRVPPRTPPPPVRAPHWS